MQQEGISKISSQFRAHLCAQLFFCLAPPILASLGFVDTFGPKRLAATDDVFPRKLGRPSKMDCGERNELYAFGVRPVDTTLLV
jgi:hypothetical protein